MNDITMAVPVNSEKLSPYEEVPQVQSNHQQPLSDMKGIPEALGIHAGYVFNHLEILTMRNRGSWAGDKFQVMAKDGREAVNTNAKLWSMIHRKGKQSSSSEVSGHNLSFSNILLRVHPHILILFNIVYRVPLPK
jgi:hypothetical protein